MLLLVIFRIWARRKYRLEFVRVDGTLAYGRPRPILSQWNSQVLLLLSRRVSGLCVRPHFESWRYWGFTSRPQSRLSIYYIFILLDSSLVKIRNLALLAAIICHILTVIRGGSLTLTELSRAFLIVIFLILLLLCNLWSKSGWLHRTVVEFTDSKIIELTWEMIDCACPHSRLSRLSHQLGWSVDHI